MLKFKNIKHLQAINLARQGKFHVGTVNPNLMIISNQINR